MKRRSGDETASNLWPCIVETADRLSRFRKSGSKLLSPPTAVKRLCSRPRRNFSGAPPARGRKGAKRTGRVLHPAFPQACHLTKSTCAASWY